MAYSQTLNLVTGDTLPALTLTLRDSNTAASGQTLDANNSATWAPINITGGSVSVFVRLVGETTLSDTLTGSIIDGTNGTVLVIFAADTFPEAGTYEGEIQITFSGGGVQTVDELLKFKVRADF
jgi:hypothetical protein